MIIDITKSGYQAGYVPKQGVGIFHPFFATANAAFRKQALLDAGGFDPHCATGEDIDVCVRVASAGYELWFEPTARVKHFHRHTLRGLLRQWFDYGLGHAYVFKKHSRRRRLELYRYDLSSRNPSPFGIARVTSLPFPIHGMIFLSSFHFMNLGLVLGAGALLLGAPPWLGWPMLALGAAAALWYFGIRFELQRPIRSIALSAIRYITDLVYVTGGLIGGLRERVIFVEATRTRRQVRSARGTRRSRGRRRGHDDAERIDRGVVGSTQSARVARR